MTDTFRAARRNMVLSQINTDNVTDRRLQSRDGDCSPGAIRAPYKAGGRLIPATMWTLGEGRVFVVPADIG